MTLNKLYFLFAIILFQSNIVFAQTETPFDPEGSDRPPMRGEGQGSTPPPNRPGFFEKMREDFRGERKEEMKEMRGEMKEARGEWKEGMKEKRDFMNSTSTGSMATPTPWKNLREDMKDARDGFKDRMRDVRKDFMEDFKEKVQKLPAPAIEAIALRLGISTTTLEAQLASGTKLKEIIKDKIKPEDMKQILPPKFATMTKAVEERGFFGDLRSRIFGKREIMLKIETNEYGEVVSSSTQGPLPGSTRFCR